MAVSPYTTTRVLTPDIMRQDWQFDKHHGEFLTGKDAHRPGELRFLCPERPCHNGLTEFEGQISAAAAQPDERPRLGRGVLSEAGPDLPSSLLDSMFEQTSCTSASRIPRLPSARAAASAGVARGRAYSSGALAGVACRWERDGYATIRWRAPVPRSEKLQEKLQSYGPVSANSHV